MILNGYLLSYTICLKFDLKKFESADRRDGSFPSGKLWYKFLNVLDAFYDEFCSFLMQA